MVAAQFAVFGEHWRIGLRGAWLPPLPLDLSESGQASLRRARVDGFTITAKGCGLLHAGPIEFPLCGGVEAGALRAIALEPVRNPEAATQPYVGLELGAGFTWTPVHHLGVGLELDAVVPLASGGYALEGAEVLGATPAGLRVLAGVELRLP